MLSSRRHKINLTDNKPLKAATKLAAAKLARKSEKKLGKQALKSSRDHENQQKIKKNLGKLAQPTLSFFFHKTCRVRKFQSLNQYEF